MSAAWNHFLTAFEATGRDRVDGYDRGHFDGLDDDERARAHAMILARAEAGEAPELRALPLLGTAEARACAERVAARERAPTVRRLAACEAAWALTGDAAWERAVAALAVEDGLVGDMALTALCNAKLTGAGLRHVTALLLVEADPVSAVQLAKAVLRGHGFSVDDPEDFTRALPLVRQLVAADLGARTENVARVDELIARHAAGA